ncbi:MepB family protein [Myroides injenensis]|uniref:MepB family protein n=1 Tax=Myroides injenensis TaxID=1183151 RepID=UPI00226F4516|nr:MepB family protein [Myroides injenensis]
MNEILLPLTTILFGTEQEVVFCDYKEFSEINDYKACEFSLGDKRIIYREAKITPKKVGLFVAIWKRNALGVTQPYEETDCFDYIVIKVEENGKKGLFVFSKEKLVKLEMINTMLKEGKRGVRVYPSWVLPQNKQALATQKKQISSFYILK